jgi:hypothetical protein
MKKLTDAFPTMESMENRRVPRQKIDLLSNQVYRLGAQFGLSPCQTGFMPHTMHLVNPQRTPYE